MCLVCFLRTGFISLDKYVGDQTIQNYTINNNKNTLFVIKIGVIMLFINGVINTKFECTPQNRTYRLAGHSKHGPVLDTN